MHRIGIVGMSWRQRRPDLLAAMTIAREARETRVPLLRDATGVEELVYLGTCGRVEVVFTTDGSVSFDTIRRRVFTALMGREPKAGEAEHALRAWHGEGAAEHLFVVASGLDSARVGESEITGQLRDALALATACGTAGPRLAGVFDEALKVARRVRPLTEGRIGTVSLAEIAAHHALERARRTPGVVALVGVSPMTEQCATLLAANGISMLIVNRTVSRAEALAAKVGAQARSLETFRAAPDAVEAVVLATGAPEPVLGRAELERITARTASGEPVLVIDLGVPPNVTPEAAAAADVPRLGMDRISDEAAEGREKLLLGFADAREIIDESVVEFRKHTAERLVGSMIAELRLNYRRTALEGVERLFAKSFPTLPEKERDDIRRWAETLANRMAHLPSVGLRDLAFEIGPAAVETFFGSNGAPVRRAVARAADDAGNEALKPERMTS